MQITLRTLFLCSFIFLYGQSIFAQCTFANPSGIPNISDQGTGPGLIAWTTPTNAQSSDNAVTTAVSKVSAASTQFTHYIYARGFAFTLPPLAVICGIQVTVQRKQQGVVNAAYIRDNTVELVKGGAITGNNHASPTNWTSTIQTVTYGNDTDTWSASWTPTDINSNDFGVMLTANVSAGSTMATLSAQIDYITISVAYYDGALPIELIYFSAKRNIDKVILSWMTASETNTNHFVIERSKDAILFEPATTVKAAGNSIKLLSYSCPDEDPLNGLSYYRLKEVDNNGTFNYSPLVSVSIEAKPGFHKIFPLKGNILTLQLAIREEANVEIGILNLTGEKVRAFSQNMSGGLTNINMNVENLVSGIYFIEAKLGGEEFYSKVYVLKE